MDNLEITNGILSPKYDKYNNHYSVRVDSDVDRLEFSDLDDAKVFGNDHLKSGQNDLVISIPVDDTYDYIYLNVIKDDKDAMVFDESSVSQRLEVSALPGYVAPLIASSCFLIILTLYALLFRK